MAFVDATGLQRWCLRRGSERPFLYGSSWEHLGNHAHQILPQSSSYYTPCNFLLQFRIQIRVGLRIPSDLHIIHELSASSAQLAIFYSPLLTLGLYLRNLKSRSNHYIITENNQNLLFCLLFLLSFWWWQAKLCVKLHQNYAQLILKITCDPFS